MNNSFEVKESQPTDSDDSISLVFESKMPAIFEDIPKDLIVIDPVVTKEVPDFEATRTLIFDFTEKEIYSITADVKTVKNTSDIWLSANVILI